MKPNGFR